MNLKHEINNTKRIDIKQAKSLFKKGLEDSREPFLKRDFYAYFLFERIEAKISLTLQDYSKFDQGSIDDLVPAPPITIKKSLYYDSNNFSDIVRQENELEHEEFYYEQLMNANENKFISVSKVIPLANDFISILEKLAEDSKLPLRSVVDLFRLTAYPKDPNRKDIFVPQNVDIDMIAVELLSISEKIYDCLINIIDVILVTQICFTLIIVEIESVMIEIESIIAGLNSFLIEIGSSKIENESTMNEIGPDLPLSKVKNALIMYAPFLCLEKKISNLKNYEDIFDYMNHTVHLPFRLTGCFMIFLKEQIYSKSERLIKKAKSDFKDIDLDFNLDDLADQISNGFFKKEIIGILLNFNIEETQQINSLIYYIEKIVYRCMLEIKEKEIYTFFQSYIPTQAKLENNEGDFKDPQENITEDLFNDPYLTTSTTNHSPISLLKIKPRTRRRNIEKIAKANGKAKNQVTVKDQLEYNNQISNLIHHKRDDFINQKFLINSCLRNKKFIRECSQKGIKLYLVSDGKMKNILFELKKKNLIPYEKTKAAVFYPADKEIIFNIAKEVSLVMAQKGRKKKFKRPGIICRPKKTAKE